ncbi:TetR/AcrR family transcriptional regulator [Jiella sp. MQZ9-1]|uniref:TetR family transcriptional regulator n=1 Tax=Jiella flava TaxID=2816857 RepID=A0A939FWN1_9HYPH|nr:TetR/AcrR family transcriptional regulator [Jiella flava]MBO0661601.1 TetR family transcriptional regulator [Jiella flava]MCD2470243.1 TetR/AcrR family transcriptional regulator [Jiella flava]
MDTIADTSRTDKRGRDTRSAIRKQALALFAERGYGAVSMRDIAEAAGIRQGAIYNHFAGKQDLLADLMISHLDRLLAALVRAVPAGGDPMRRLEAFASFHVGYHLDQPDDVVIADMELRSLEAGRRGAEVHALRDRYAGVLATILEDGRRTGRFQTPNAKVQAGALIAMMTGITVWSRDGAALTREAVTAHYVQMVMQSVGLIWPLGEEAGCSTAQ